MGRRKVVACADIIAPFKIALNDVAPAVLRRDCPPEDIGGPLGYAEILEVIGDPKHERHAELAEWVVEDFEIVDADWLAKQLTTLAERWSRK
jgi:hypothetical protein